MWLKSWRKNVKSGLYSTCNAQLECLLFVVNSWFQASWMHISSFVVQSLWWDENACTTYSQSPWYYWYKMNLLVLQVSSLAWRCWRNGMQYEGIFSVFKFCKLSFIHWSFTWICSQGFNILSLMLNFRLNEFIARYISSCWQAISDLNIWICYHMS